MADQKTEFIQCQLTSKNVLPMKANENVWVKLCKKNKCTRADSADGHMRECKIFKHFILINF